MTATAEEPKEQVPDDEEPDSIKTYAVPDAPALTFLDATPSEITQPSSGQEFLTEVLSGFGRSGQFQQGLAVNSDLWYLLGTKWGGSITPEQYRASFFWRAWANTSFSLGTVKSQGEGVLDGDTDFALGLRTVLYDKQDLLLNETYSKAVSQARLDCLQGPNMTKEEAKACTRAKLKDSRSSAANAWNASRVSLAVASGLRFGQSRLSESDWIGASAWLNGSFGIGSHVQVLGYARYDYRDLTDSNIVRGGGRINLGSARVNGFAEALVQHDLNAETDETTGRWALGVSCGFSPSLWLTGSLGSTFETSRDPLAVLATLKYNFSTVPELDHSK